MKSFTLKRDYDINKYDSLRFYKFSRNQNIVLKMLRMILRMYLITLILIKLDIINIIKKYVPDFMHIETGKHLRSKNVNYV